MPVLGSAKRISERVFPLAGFVIGFCLPRNYSQQGLRIMGMSVVVVFIFLAAHPR
jgi:hypothetical protein